MIKLHATRSLARSVAVFFCPTGDFILCMGMHPAAQGSLIIVQLSMAVFFYKIYFNLECLNFGDEYARCFDSSSAITIGFMRSSKVNNVQYAFSNSSNNSALVFDFAMLTPIKYKQKPPEKHRWLEASNN